MGARPCKCSGVSDSFVIPLAVACQAHLFMGFFKQECWSGLPFPPPGDLLDPGIEPMFLMSPALAGGFFITSATCLYPSTKKKREREREKENNFKKKSRLS